MSFEIVPVSKNDRQDDTHPAFGMASVVRTSSSPGAVLFDSEIRHQHFVSLRISKAVRQRNLNRDWIFAGSEIIEVHFSEAQWAQLISSIGSSGTPTTIAWTEKDGSIPGMPYEPRMALSLDEVKLTTERVYARALEALKAAEERPTKSNVRAARMALEGAAGNNVFAAASLSEHVEETVAKAKADIEAMVTTKMDSDREIEDRKDQLRQGIVGVLAMEPVDIELVGENLPIGEDDID